MAHHITISLDPNLSPLIRFDEEINPYVLFNYQIGTPSKIDLSQFPKLASVKSSHKYIPDFISINGRLAVSSRAKDVIDSFEPDLHQFIPVHLAPKPFKELRMRHDKSLIRSPFYLLNIQTCLDAIILHLSDFRMKTKFSRQYLFRNLFGKVILDRNAVAGHHLWRSSPLLPNYIFMSDALFAAVKAPKLLGITSEQFSEV